MVAARSVLIAKITFSGKLRKVGNLKQMLLIPPVFFQLKKKLLFGFKFNFIFLEQSSSPGTRAPCLRKCRGVP